MTYQVMDNEGTVWGEGETVDEAYQAAVENITETFTDTGQPVPGWLQSGELDGRGYKITSAPCRVYEVVAARPPPAPDAVMSAMETETDPLPDAVASAWDTELNPPPKPTSKARPSYNLTQERYEQAWREKRRLR